MYNGVNMNGMDIINTRYNNMNTTQKPSIMWEKWKDPFGGDDEISQPEQDGNSYDDDEIDKESFNHPIKMLATPMGMIPLTEHTRPGKVFNFWTGHTNFNITKNIAETIEKVDGVETLSIFTRYRFRVSIGKMFSESKVRVAIAEAVAKMG